nr:TrbC/VirB2 family protein [Qipengyuania flava]
MGAQAFRARPGRGSRCDRGLPDPTASSPPDRRPSMTKTTILYPRWPLYATALAFSLLLVAPAHAAGSGMPWEVPLQSILESIEGPVAKIVAVIIIIVTGLTLAFGDTSGGFRRLVQIVFGLSIAFAASSFFLSFFSFGGGALI